MYPKIREDQLDDIHVLDSTYYALIKMLNIRRSIIAEGYISAGLQMRTLRKLTKALEVQTYASGNQILTIQSLEELFKDDPKE